MKIREALKRINSTLLEMFLGIIFWGVLCQLVGAFLVKDQMMYAGSLWFGILLAVTSTIHMYRSLDRALDREEKQASRAIFRSYTIRYALVATILIMIAITGVLNPLIVFLAYMGLKVAAFIQPITHKLCNKTG